MGLLSFLFRTVGFTAGFLVPVVGGLYAASVGKVKEANYYLRVLFVWVTCDFIFSPVLGAILGLISPLLWPALFSGLTLALVIPRCHVLEKGDSCIVTAINSGYFNKLIDQCKDAIQPVKCKVEEFMEPLLIQKDESKKEE